MTHPRGSLALAVVGLYWCAAVGASPPEQFRAWGTAGPASPPPPRGWTEAVSPEKGPPLPATSAPERERAYMLLARDPLASSSLDAVAAPQERAEKLDAACARGEYESLCFALHALTDLADVLAEVTDLKSAEGQTIPADHVDVRVARGVRTVVDAAGKTYRLEPFLLERRASFDLAAWTSAQIWLTVNAPINAAAGKYRGRVVIRVGGRESGTLPLVIDVLPFSLPLAPAEMMMYFARPPSDDRLLRQELVDQREHGMTAVDSALVVQIASRDRHFAEDDAEATRAYCRRLMGAAKEVFRGLRFPVTVEVGHQIAFYWDQASNWFKFWAHSPQIDSDFMQALNLVVDLAQQEGWPPLRAYSLDEAGAHGLLDEAGYYYGLIKREAPQLPTWTTIGGGMALGYNEIGKLDRLVDYMATNRFTPEIARALAGRGKPFGVYNGAGSIPAGARFFFGFYGYKTAAAQVSQWAYSFSDSVFTGGGLRADDDGYVYCAADGPLPSQMWEAVRAGVDDYRFLELLRRLIVAGKLSGRPTASAEKAMGDVLGRIPWGFQALDSADKLAPPSPAALREWRGRIVKEIVALLPVVSGAAKLQMLTGPSPARSPFDLPWPPQPREKVTLGPELLPPSGFEAGMGPWRIEAWKGPGAGEIVEGPAHSGGHSVRIHVSADASSDTVTVLVWPTWGGGGLNLALDGGKTYEFSAWIKREGASPLPQLRVSVPEGAARGVRSGADEPEADGWQRAWVRVEMAYRATPSYLGVWVQGPGTVWLDDLSLREVTSRPGPRPPEWYE